MPPDEKDGTGAGSDQTPRQGEVYFEFHQVGRSMRVCAVDAGTGIEVVIMGPATASQNDLKTLALRKLKVRLEQQDG